MGCGVSVPAEAVKEIGAAQARQEHMLRVVEAVGGAMHLDVKLHSVSGRREGRLLTYPPQLLRVVKSMKAALKSPLKY